jgi:choline dehydrogenase-like flavoprotein
MTQLELGDGSSHVTLLRVATLTGRKFTVRPRIVVLAAGGIENARLLLASRSDRPTGLGNEYDAVGRYFMEHLHVGVGHMIVNPGEPRPNFYRRGARDGADVSGAIAPTVLAMRRHRLLGTSIAIEGASYTVGRQRLSRPTEATFAAIRFYRKLHAGRLRPAAAMARTVLLQTANIPRRFTTWKKAREAWNRADVPRGARPIYSLYFRAEQAPDPDSRVTLTKRLDALGVPEVQLAWRVVPDDIASIGAWLKVLENDFGAAGFGRVVLPEDGWQSGIIGGPHQMGTTRMSADPKLGVVDADCRVHSVENLYVAGSSVFSTGGYANPTFTLIALALRLADTLRNRLCNEKAVEAPRSEQK